MRIIGPRYKTYEGALKRAAFENSLAKHEFERGYKARMYRYSVRADAFDDKLVYRVERNIVKQEG